MSSGPTDLSTWAGTSSFTVTSVSGGRVAPPLRRGQVAFPGPVCRLRVGPGGAAWCRLDASRQVQGTSDASGASEADSMSPARSSPQGGTGSSYPPHKHDEDRGRASRLCLREIYFPDAGSSPARTRTQPPQPAGPAVSHQRVYGTAERPTTSSKRSAPTTSSWFRTAGMWAGDFGARGYDMCLHLNVMAGLGQTRAWICDDPAHACPRDPGPVSPSTPAALPGGSRPRRLPSSPASLATPRSPRRRHGRCSGRRSRQTTGVRAEEAEGVRWRASGCCGLCSTSPVLRSNKGGRCMPTRPRSPSSARTTRRSGCPAERPQASTVPPLACFCSSADPSSTQSPRFRTMADKSSMTRASPAARSLPDGAHDDIGCHRASRCIV